MRDVGVIYIAVSYTNIANATHVVLNVFATMLKRSSQNFDNTFMYFENISYTRFTHIIQCRHTVFEHI